MNRPLDRGAAVDAIRFKTWLARFSGYRNPVTQRLVELWLAQFSKADADLAARLLDAIVFVDHGHIHACFRQLLNGLEGWDKSKNKRVGRWFFVPFSTSSGESADSIVYAFRMATGMNKKSFNDLFIYRSELLMCQPQPADTVVLIDDFSGTGRQACEAWRDFFQELLPGGPRVILLLVAATATALDNITANTDLQPVCCETLHKSANFFDQECTHFSAAEKEALLKYCEKADKKNPKGFGDGGLVVVLAHRCPNNVIPVLHVHNQKWQGLFPRHD